MNSRVGGIISYIDTRVRYSKASDLRLGMDDYEYISESVANGNSMTILKMDLGTEVEVFLRNMSTDDITMAKSALEEVILYYSHSQSMTDSLTNIQLVIEDMLTDHSLIDISRELMRNILYLIDDTLGEFNMLDCDLYVLGWDKGVKSLYLTIMIV